MLNRRSTLGFILAAPLALRVHADKASPPQAWDNAANLPFPVQEIYPAAHKGRLYIAGGIASRLGVPYFTERCVSYEPEADRWVDAPELPEARHHAALVSTGSRLLMIGGFNGGYTHIWRMRASVHELVGETWEERTPLPQPQAEGVLSYHNGRIHLVSGQQPKGKANRSRDDHSETSDHWIWVDEAAGCTDTHTTQQCQRWLGWRRAHRCRRADGQRQPCNQ